MGKLIYSMLVSADGYINSPNGSFDWADPDDDVLAYITERQRAMGAYLYGRRYYDTMRSWATLRSVPGLREVDYTFSDLWNATPKYVYSRTLTEPPTLNTNLRSAVDLDEIRALKDASEKHVTVEGTQIARACLEAGLVDGISAYVVPIATGGGTPFYPAGMPLSLTLVDEHRFTSGFVNVRYAVNY
ncbi:dihydrofolate reductase family protein [Demequina sp.]|uniref:dihydrofolate reductase family protein n=1 Tax=Demequina sp. TaxID=2050685 RepID=UPI003D0CDAEA